MWRLACLEDWSQSPVCQWDQRYSPWCLCRLKGGGGRGGGGLLTARYKSIPDTSPPHAMSPVANCIHYRLPCRGTSCIPYGMPILSALRSLRPQAWELPSCTVALRISVAVSSVIERITQHHHTRRKRADLTHHACICPQNSHPYFDA